MPQARAACHSGMLPQAGVDLLTASADAASQCELRCDGAWADEGVGGGRCRGQWEQGRSQDDRQGA